MTDQELHQRRLRIDHVHSRVKRCRSVQDRSRLWRTVGCGELLRFAEALTDGADRAVSLFAVQRGTPAMTPQVFPERASHFLVFADPQGTVRTAYRPGATDTPPLFVLDPNLRVLASLVLQDAQATARQVLALLDAFLPPIAPLEITTQAPVLLIPYALA